MSTDTSSQFEQTGTVTKADIWDYRDEVIELGFALSEVGLIEALPATGKSWGSMQWAADTGNNVSLFAPRHTLLDEEYEPWCDKFDLTYKRLPSFYRDCTSFMESDDGGYKPVDKVAEDLQADYQQGHDAEEIHEKHPHSTCQEDGECPYIEKLAFDPDEYDVLLGTLSTRARGRMDRESVCCLRRVPR